MRKTTVSKKDILPALFQLTQRLSISFKDGLILAACWVYLLRMIKQQLVFAFRRFNRHKLTTTINITTINIMGLTLGVLSCLVIYLFVNFEFSYDSFHADRNRIYRVVVWTTNSDGTRGEGASLPPPLAADLRREASGFSAVAGIYTDDCKVSVPEAGKAVRVFDGILAGKRQHVAFADSQYFDIFHYKWLAGNPATALNAPFSVVLTAAEAKRYFQTGQPSNWVGRPNSSAPSIRNHHQTNTRQDGGSV